ncbi:MAG: prolyl oligopeptidase family serine peptidase [Williamsia sp.]|nr:prolyl oligopeptidase family serine peptidase [Williamsia sp.]
MIKKIFRIALQATMLPASFFCSTTLLGQSVYNFTKGLMTPVPSRYGREALYMDVLAYQLYSNSMKTPAEGETFVTDERGQALKWQPVTADSLFRLRGRMGFGGGRGGGPAGPGITPGTARNSIGVGGSYIYLTYQSEKEQAALLNIKGNSGVYVNGVPHMGDAYSLGYMYIPVALKKGLNEFYVRGASVIASLSFPAKPVTLNTEDLTMPFVVVSKDNSHLQGALVVLNTSNAELKGLKIKSTCAGKELITAIPAIPAMSSRKVPFVFDGTAAPGKGKYDCAVALMRDASIVDETKVPVEAVTAAEQYSATFVSNIDGSLQYYAVTPQQPGTNTTDAALFLSVHGAGVEAIGQARAYKPKDWGTLVAATNRRPRGFNWEDWGRLDALEVLAIGKEKFKPDPQHIYLTGHSMGGHGTWFLGATYPDKWAAIGACSGYPTLKGYGSADGLIPDSSNNPLEQMLLRSGNQSDVPKLASNYKPLGVYVLHGDADRTVSVEYARQMRKVLGEFHTDLSYYEYPNGEHWFGDQSVDWKPLFDFFKWHTLARDSAVDKVDFMTASPGIAADYHWASVQQQIYPLQYSRILLNRNKLGKAITGTTANVKLLKLELDNFGTGAALKITLDGCAISYITRSERDSLFLLKEKDQWVVGKSPEPDQKNPQRYGTFKDAFNNRMVFVYGTAGTKEENEWSLQKARFDAETWYYRGNGAVDIIADKEYSAERYKDRGVILFGNKQTNKAWNLLLGDCPIQIARNLVTAGSHSWKGDDLSAYFVWPIKGSAIASVGVVSGSGLKGMKAAFANQYFAGASGFPDFMIYGFNMLQAGAKEMKMAGFFDNDWKIDPANEAVNAGALSARVP